MTDASPSPATPALSLREFEPTLAEFEAALAQLLLTTRRDGQARRDSTEQNDALGQVLALHRSVLDELSSTRSALRRIAVALGAQDGETFGPDELARAVELQSEGFSKQIAASDELRAALREAQEAVEGWYADSVQAQYEVMFARFGDDADGDVRCGVANLSNANRIIQKVRAAAGSTTP